MCDKTEIYSTTKVLMGKREKRKVRKEREIWNLGLFFLGGFPAGLAEDLELAKVGLGQRKGTWEDGQDECQFENLPVFQIFAFFCYLSLSLPIMMKVCVFVCLRVGGETREGNKGKSEVVCQ